jgi:16S rRNA (cytidine1402-2'-O)-methyltransferase
MPDSPTTGSLILIPNTLDLGEPEPVDIRDVLADGVLREAARLTHWVVEDARSARAFLKRVHAVHPLVQPLQTLDIRELPRPQKGSGGKPAPAVTRGAQGAATGASPFTPLLAPALAGHDIGLLSEAGLPAVADPGSTLVAAAHAQGVPVRVLPGPSSLLLALAASGLNGQHFAFVGYLPQDSTARIARIRELEATSRKLGQAQLFIETPYRNEAMLEALLATLAPTARLSVSAGLTLARAFTRTDTVAVWRSGSTPPLGKTPAIFGIQA